MTDTPARFITAVEFHAHELAHPLRLNAADRARHVAFLRHMDAVAEAAEREPHRRASDVASAMPFVPPEHCGTDPI